MSQPTKPSRSPNHEVHAADEARVIPPPGADQQRFRSHQRLVDTLRAALALPALDAPFPWQTLLFAKFLAGDIPRVAAGVVRADCVRRGLPRPNVAVRFVSRSMT